MPVFNCTIEDGHCIIRDNGNVILVDTGSPVTIHQTNSFTFAGQVYHPAGFPGLTIQQLRELTNINDLTTLLGMDIMKSYQVLFIYHAGQVFFENGGLDHKGDLFNMGIVMGIPVVEAKVGQVNLKFFLDSGARLSYLGSEFIAQYPYLGRESDFYPGIGRYEADVHEVPTSIERFEFTVKYAVPPPMVAGILSMAKVNGILGYDIFKNFNVCLDFPQDTYSIY